MLNMLLNIFLTVSALNLINLTDFILIVEILLFQNAQNESAGSDEYISSVSWIKEGNILAVGDSQGAADLW